MCTRRGVKPHSSRPCPVRNKKCNTCEKVGHSSKMCRSKPQKIQLCKIKRITFAKANISSEQASPASEMGMCYTRKEILSMSMTWEFMTLSKCKVKKQVDTGADSRVMSSKKWTKLGKPQLDGKIRHLEVYDGHQLTLLVSLTCDVECNGSRHTQNQLAVVQTDKEFGLLGRDLLPKHGVDNLKTKHLVAIKV